MFFGCSIHYCCLLQAANMLRLLVLGLLLSAVLITADTKHSEHAETKSESYSDSEEKSSFESHSESNSKVDSQTKSFSSNHQENFKSNSELSEYSEESVTSQQSQEETHAFKKEHKQHQSSNNAATSTATTDSSSEIKQKYNQKSTATDSENFQTFNEEQNNSKQSKNKNSNTATAVSGAFSSNKLAHKNKQQLIGTASANLETFNNNRESNNNFNSATAIAEAFSKNEYAEINDQQLTATVSANSQTFNNNRQSNKNFNSATAPAEAFSDNEYAEINDQQSTATAFANSQTFNAARSNNFNSGRAYAFADSNNFSQNNNQKSTSTYANSEINNYPLYLLQTGNHNLNNHGKYNEASANAFSNYEFQNDYQNLYSLAYANALSHILLSQQVNANTNAFSNNLFNKQPNEPTLADIQKALRFIKHHQFSSKQSEENVNNDYFQSQKINSLPSGKHNMQLIDLYGLANVLSGNSKHERNSGARANACSHNQRHGSSLTFSSAANANTQNQQLSLLQVLRGNPNAQATITIDEIVEVPETKEDEENNPLEDLILDSVEIPQNLPQGVTQNLIAQLLLNPQTLELIPVAEELVVSPVSVDRVVQPYCSYTIIGEVLKNSIVQRLNSDATSLKTDTFPAILLGISVVAEEVAQGVDFDNAYSSESVVLAIGDRNRNIASSLNKKLGNYIASKSESLRSAIHKILSNCNGVISINDFVLCDQKISTVVQSNPEYLPAATLIVEVGKLAHIYKQVRPHIEAAAKEGSEQELFARGKLALEPLIRQLAKIIRITNSI